MLPNKNQKNQISRDAAEALNRRDRRKLGQLNGGVKIYGSTKPFTGPIGDRAVKIIPKPSTNKYDKTS